MLYRHQNIEVVHIEVENIEVVCVPLRLAGHARATELSWRGRGARPAGGRIRRTPGRSAAAGRGAGTARPGLGWTGLAAR